MNSAWVHDPWQDTWRLFTNVGSPHLLVSDFSRAPAKVLDPNRLPWALSPEQRVLGLHTIGYPQSNGDGLPNTYFCVHVYCDDETFSFVSTVAEMLRRLCDLFDQALGLNVLKASDGGGFIMWTRL